MARFSGTVRWFDNTKGYGFLGHASGPDVFVHFSAIQTADYQRIHEGEPLEFGVVNTKLSSLGAQDKVIDMANADKLPIPDELQSTDVVEGEKDLAPAKLRSTRANRK
jgi:CspA family cold shock protein